MGDEQDATGAPEPWDREPPLALDEVTLRQVHAGASMNRRGSDPTVVWHDVDALIESLAAEVLWHRRHSPVWPWEP